MNRRCKTNAAPEASRTHVMGDATLAGATVKASFAAGSYVVARQDTILNATAGIVGSFGALVDNAAASSQFE
jgi:hypothetical protein